MDVDAIIIGTGLAESIVAAALSKAGYSIAHLDTHAYYGGDHASLTLDELIEWADRHVEPTDSAGDTYTATQRRRFTSISRSQSTLPQSRQYSLSLTPSIIPSIGSLIDSLVASGVSRYGGFKLLEKVAIFDRPGCVKPVPGSKEDVFKNKELSLIDKRRLMRFLMFAAGEFEGKPELQGHEETPLPQFLREKFSIAGQSADAITYALAFCPSSLGHTLPALRRIRQYLRSSGRYGPSPFLVGHYGGLGEIAQGFCRTAAVNGATYVLGRKVSSIVPNESSSPEKQYSVQLEDLDKEITGSVVVAAPDYVSPELAAAGGDAEGVASYARCIAIIDQPISFSALDEQPEESSPYDDQSETAEGASQATPSTVDTALLVFPPGSVPGGSTATVAQVLISGEGSMATPRGKFLLHISLALNSEEARLVVAEDVLRPYLDATLTLGAGAAPSPLFTLFYVEHPPSASTSTASQLLVTPQRGFPLDQNADAAAMQAEEMFWKAVRELKAAGKRPRRRQNEEGQEAEGDAAGQTEVEAFWPPLDAPLDDDEW